MAKDEKKMKRIKLWLVNQNMTPEEMAEIGGSLVAESMKQSIAQALEGKEYL